MKFNIIHEKSLNFNIGQKIHLQKAVSTKNNCFMYENYGYGIILKLNPKTAKVKIFKAEKQFKINTIVIVDYDFIFTLNDDEWNKMKNLKQ